MKKIILFILLLSAFNIHAQLSPRTDVNYMHFNKIPPAGTKFDSILAIRGSDGFMTKIPVSQLFSYLPKFVPLSGTEALKPVTGAIEITSGNALVTKDNYMIIGAAENLDVENATRYARSSWYSGDGNSLMEMTTTNDDASKFADLQLRTNTATGVNDILVANSSESAGIVDVLDRSAIDPENKLIYAQRKYVDNAVIASVPAERDEVFTYSGSNNFIVADTIFVLNGVYRNGVRLEKTVEYNFTPPKTITIIPTLITGEKINVIYGYSVNPESIVSTTSVITQNGTSAITSGAVYDGLINKAEPVYTNNLFIYGTQLPDLGLNPNTGAVITQIGFCYGTEFRPVTPGDIVYTKLDANETGINIVFYKADKSYLTGVIFNSSVLQTTVPALAAYARVTFRTENVGIKQYSLNDPTLKYVRGGKFLPNSILYGGQTQFTGNWDAIGDSITFFSMWQEFILNKYPLNLKNNGTAGQRMSGASGMWVTAFDGGSKSIRSDTDFVTFFGGMNDFLNSVTLGATDSTDTNTAMGGFNAFINTFYTNFPTKTLIVMSPTLGSNALFTEGGFKNSAGYTSFDLADAMAARCKALGIPYADIIHNCGITRTNQLTYIPDRIHPNKSGGEKIGGVLRGYMNAIDNFKN